MVGALDAVGSLRRLRHRVGVGVFAVALAGVTTVVISSLIGFNPSAADVKYDYLSAAGAVWSDAYAGVFELSAEFDKFITVHYPPGSPPGAHPRTPGAILLSVPLLLVPFDGLVTLAAAVTIACGGLILLPLLRQGRVGDRVALVVLSLISAPVFITLRFSGQAALVAVLTLYGWSLSGRRRGILGGILLAIAGVLKLYPLVLLLPLAFRRRATPVVTCVAAVLALNSAGIMLPGVSLADSIEVLSDASSAWIALPSNGSLVNQVVEMGTDQPLAQVIAVTLVSVGLGLALLFKRERLLRDPLPWIIAGLLIIPLSWVSYDMILLSALGSMLVANRSHLRLISIVGWMAWIVPVLVYPFSVGGLGVSSLFVRMLLLAIWWTGWIGWRDSGLGSTWSSPAPTESPGAEPPRLARTGIALQDTEVSDSTLVAEAGVRRKPDEPRPTVQYSLSTV